MIRFAAVLPLLALFGFGSCQKSEPPTRNADAAPTSAAAKTGWVVLRPEGRGELRVRVKVARTAAERQRGLMYVRELPRDDGMLFVFPTDEVQSFWMKNTYIPLDMIFIDRDLVVVGVVENAEPHTLDSRSVDEPSRYVLEVNGGWARENGVGPGTKCEFIGI